MPSMEQYLSVMKSTPSLMEMTRNPFVLRLFVDVLPSMVVADTSLQHITRYSLYKALSTVVDLFELLCALLALEMLKANVLTLRASVVIAASGDGGADSVIWRDVQDAADEWLSTDPAATAALRSQYDALSRRDKARCALPIDARHCLSWEFDRFRGCFSALCLCICVCA